jgi:glycosyltransferase involved in cell wall biosynthesis
MHIAFILESLRSGGAQNMILIIAAALAERGHNIDLLVLNAEGSLASRVPASAQVVKIPAGNVTLARLQCLLADPFAMPALLLPVLLAPKPSHSLGYLSGVARYLADVKPDALFAAKPTVNVEAVLAHRLARSRARLVLSERTNYSAAEEDADNSRRQGISALMRRTYAHADAIVAVSKGVAKDLISQIGVRPERVVVVYNPTITPEIPVKSLEPANHPWFAKVNYGAAIILSVGRIGTQKDYPTLLGAFAKVRSRRPARLLIIGEPRSEYKRERRVAEMNMLAEQLGIAADFSLIGFQENPYAFMARAQCFALSSRYEGFPNVLLEALACGCPVVSTDCPSGPAEILNNGEFGALVPVGDPDALAAAILATLANPPDREKLINRAQVFSFETAIDNYEAVLTGGKVAQPL